MVGKSFEVEDLVWAKMKGYSPWPGKIVEPPADTKTKKSHHYVFFFGSNNYAWIPDENIELHNENMVGKYGNKKSGQLFQKAVATIIERSKDISKYRKSETTDDEITTKSKEHEEKSNDDGVKPKKKSAQSNGTPKTMKKKSSMPSSTKKPSTVKKTGRKRAHSSDLSDDNENDANFTYGELSVQFPTSHERLEESYVRLATNVPSHLNCVEEVSSNNAEGACAPVVGVLQRTYHDRPDTPPTDLTYQSEDLKRRKIQPLNKTIGFLGLNKVSQGIVKNLCHTGHSVVIWNQTPAECKDFVDNFGVQVADTPADVIDSADITFSCVSDAESVKQIVFGNCGIIRELEHRSGECKGYIEMTAMEPKISEAIGKEITMKGGRYLEAPFCGSRVDANEGTLVIFVAGDKALYEEVKTCFDAISKRHKYFSEEVGMASKIAVTFNMFTGSIYAALSEALALATKVGMQGEDFLEILSEGDIINKEKIIEKGTAMVRNQYVSNTSLKQMQQILQLGMTLGDKIAQPTPIFAAVNEVFKHCKSMRYGDHDVSAVFEVTKP